MKNGEVTPGLRRDTSHSHGVARPVCYLAAIRRRLRAARTSKAVDAVLKRALEERPELGDRLEAEASARRATLGRSAA
jgi:hypothetical protein